MLKPYSRMLIFCDKLQAKDIHSSPIRVNPCPSVAELISIGKKRMTEMRYRYITFENCTGIAYLLVHRIR